MRKPGKIISVILFFLLLVQHIAVACPMCNPGEGTGTIAAYQGTTIFLALLPFAFLAGIFFWMKNKFRKSEQDN
ncbi:MAG TPA: hypothetical protein VI757_15350 [Bacteroidia bacterium]|nr:hypothetical protein [Bacteroidia bacterium]